MLRAAYQSITIESASPSAAVRRMARSAVISHPLAAWPRKPESRALNSRAAIMPRAPSQKGSGPPSGTSSPCTLGTSQSMVLPVSMVWEMPKPMASSVRHGSRPIRPAST